MIRYPFLILLLSLAHLALWAQDGRQSFRHFEIGVTAGTPGLGVDFAMPVSEAFRLRAGFSAMPHVQTSGSLDVLLNGQLVVPSYSDDGSRTDHMGKLFEMMESFTGYQMDEKIGVYHKPTMWNGKVLVDWFPFSGRSLHFTAGVYMGPSDVATICNNPDEMHTLTGLSIYNGMYEKIMAGEPILTVGGTTVNFPSRLKDKVVEYGRMSVPAGTLADGSSFSFEPGPDGLVEANVRTRWIRPYVGAGYTCWFDKAHRTSLAIDLGCMFWGGKPSIITATGEDLAAEVHDVPGDLGRWVDFYSSLRVMPVAELRISRRLF